MSDTDLSTKSIWSATSFAEFDREIALREYEMNVQRLNDQYRFLMDNILMIQDPSEVADALSSLTREYTSRLFALEINTGGNGFVVKSLDDGSSRYVAWVTNPYQDRDGEYFADSAHVEFEQYLDNNTDEAPVLLFWHEKATAHTFPVDWWDYSDKFFIYSGVMTKEETDRWNNAVARMREIDPDVKFGMSHGSKVLRRDPNEPNVILQYRTKEISILPLDSASNPHTAIMQGQDQDIEEQMQKLEFLKHLYGEDEAQLVYQKRRKISEANAALGISEKDFKDKWLEFQSQDVIKSVDEQFDDILNSSGEDINIDADSDDDTEPAPVKDGDVDSTLEARKRVKAGIVELINHVFDERMGSVNDLVGQIVATQLEGVQFKSLDSLTTRLGDLSSQLATVQANKEAVAELKAEVASIVASDLGSGALGFTNNHIQKAFTGEEKPVEPKVVTSKPEEDDLEWLQIDIRGL